MKSSDTQYLTETEEEIVYLLIELGLKTNEARLLVVFFRRNDITSRDIERITDLRQPEVSIAISGLIKRRWVDVTSLIAVNKGRPIKVYSLIQTIEEILDEIGEEISKEHDEKLKLLKRIREIVKH